MTSSTDDFSFHFNDNIIFSENELKETLQHLTSLPPGAYDSLVRKLVSPPPNISRPVLELVLSCEILSSQFNDLLTFCPASECGDSFARWLKDDFPVLPDYFSSSSTPIEVLDKISLSIPLLYAFEREMHMELSKHRAEVEYSLLVIEAFLRFITPSGSSGPSNSVEEDLPFKAKQSQRSRKNARNRGSVVVVFDTKVSKACHFLHIAIPKTGDDARYALHGLVQNLSKLLEVWIYFFCV